MKGCHVLADPGEPGRVILRYLPGKVHEPDVPVAKLMKAIDVESYRGKRLSVQVKLEILGEDRYAASWFRLLGSNDASSDVTFKEVSNRVFGPGEHEVDIEFDCPVDLTALVLSLEAGRTAQVAFDQVVFELIES